MQKYKMPPEDADDFRGYFAMVKARNPDPHWANGLEMSEWWLRLQSADTITQADIDSFIARWKEEKNTGSGWMSLGHEFMGWAKARGFQV